ncbi:MAG: preprotein translocase subunit SecA [Candidatus Paracaedibacteraceae bacterium]|nr:preprotein translocase subunit SecA [Candidatus Paracaedibacteraceae bacterium]
MIAALVHKIFGSANDRIIKKYTRIVQQINHLEEDYIKLSDDQIKAKTTEFKERLEKGQTLEQILPEAFATVREASKRALGMRPFDVQLVGGMVLNQGMITEMRTGEGKTLVATLPIYLNALSGKGVHAVTVNDYLATRDSSWMGILYNFLGLSVGCIVHGLSDSQRRDMYARDITYGTNHEFGFDYLRDNMKFRKDEMVMRPFNFAIVDECDSILIDEARTPLIISGSAEDSSESYNTINKLIPPLTEEDYEKDEKQRSVTLTDSGVEKIEQLLISNNLIKGNSLYDVQNIGVVHHVNAALKAHKLFARDVDYIVKDDKVIIIDEFTGRMMEGRRYSDGLHQALEAKEGVTVEMENQTLASVTYQNFFRLYPKMAGMTGTAVTESVEFEEIYNLCPVEVPTNLPIARIDHDDEIFLTAKEKYEAVLIQIRECYARKQPVLVGTTSIEKSEFISNILKSDNIPHQVLNARYHEQEAYIIADAGRSGAVTIATNMAGRGTDIKLGGSLEMRVERELAEVAEGPDRDRLIEEIKRDVQADQKRVKEAGGLFVIGTERHESRRIDNQLRGRSGRQGDPGASRFYISLEDDLMRIFGSQKLDVMLRKLGVQEGEAISHQWINKALERAQQKVEARNFDIRKHLLRYDDVMNDQRKIIYEQRRDLMNTDNISNMVTDMREEVIHDCVDAHVPDNSLPEQWDIQGLHAECIRLFALNIDFQTWIDEDGISALDVKKRINALHMELLSSKENTYGETMIRMSERTLLLRILDQAWKDHLLSLDHLRQGINLRAYAQGNPLNEYKREAYNLFQFMMGRVKAELISALSHFELSLPEGLSLESALSPRLDFDAMRESMPNWSNDFESDEDDRNTFELVHAPSLEIDPKDPTTWGRVLRNADCPCGSGKKYKHCHGAV